MLGKNAMMNMPIVLLRDGVEDAQGRSHILANIQAAIGIADILKTTLGPRGLDKLIHNDREVTITNDGATILQKLNIDHPAARIMSDISIAQDQEVGDGTTSVVLLASEILNEVKFLIEDGVKPSAIIKGLSMAKEIALAELDKCFKDLSEKSDEERRELYINCATTTLSSKILGGASIRQFATLAVDTCQQLGAGLSFINTDIKKIVGGSVEESIIHSGVVFGKTFSYAGFEMNIKSYENPKILILNHELELKAEKDNAEARIKDPSQYQSIINAEWDIIYEKLDKIISTGANIVISKLPIGDLATQYLSDKDIFCAGRVDDGDANRLAKISGGRIMTSFLDMDSSCLGKVDKFEEKQVGKERFNFFHSSNNLCCTVILRGGANQFLDEAERSFHDALCVVKRCMETNKIVAGGGATDMAISTKVRTHAMTISGKLQVIMLAFAKAFEIIPRTLAANAGADPTLTLNQLRAKYNDEDNEIFYGVDCIGKEVVVDTIEKFIWEPCLIKRNSLVSAVEAACIILSIDETVRHPPNRTPDGPNVGRGMR